MNYNLDSDPHVTLTDGILRVSPPPSMALADLLQHVEILGEAVRAAGHPTLILDMRMHTELGATEQVLLAHHCGLHLRGARVAVLVPARTGQGQRAARSLGLDLRSFEDEDWALEWLREEG